jgi:LPS sulfotransferase NodH
MSSGVILLCNTDGCRGDPHSFFARPASENDLNHFAPKALFRVLFPDVDVPVEMGQAAAEMVLRASQAAIAALTRGDNKVDIYDNCQLFAVSACETD